MRQLIPTGPLNFLLACLLAFSPAAASQERPASRRTPATANRAVFLDKQGVIRWRDDGSEVRLFGANYVLTTASDYRAAGYLGANRKQMIDEDMAQFARLGWDGLRLTFWGDWEASDSLGNLIENDHLDLLDYLIARARERGIYLLLSPIQLYNAKWPDSLGDTTAPGFGRRYRRDEMGTNPRAVAAQANYLRQVLNHVNRYTGLALKQEPAILFVELVNEPVHHPEDIPGSISYINTLTAAVRSTGCTKLVFYNVSQDFRITDAIRRSRAQGVTFGWYPSGLNAGHELQGNFLRAVDGYPEMLRPGLGRLPRIVYEFDTPDLRTGTLYPAMARTFRQVGTQFAAMFAYDMQRTASRNLGWQTHYLSLAYTPRKAMSAIIAAEAMRRLPPRESYGAYPANTRFGDFHLFPEENRSELLARDAFLYAGTTRSEPPAPAALERIAGYGSSPLVSYAGTGVYFLDRLRPGLWRLEVYPDAVPVRDPFEPPKVGKIVTRAIRRAWPMTVRLPDLGESFTVQRLARREAASGIAAAAGRFTVSPGVYLLSARGRVSPDSLPAWVGHVGLAEFHPPPLDTLPLSVEPLAAWEYLRDREASVGARIVDLSPPDSARVYARLLAGDFWRAYPMRTAGAYEYAATIAPGELREGPHEFVITVYRGDSATTYPAAEPGDPQDWNYGAHASWHFTVVHPGTPLRLFDARNDASRLAFTRIGDAGRRGLFGLGISPATGQPLFRFTLPVDSSGWSPPDYTASLAILDRIRPRGETIVQAKALRLRLRGAGPSQRCHVTLMEDDGTSWTASLEVDSAWSERTIPLDSLRVGRGVLLPEGFPGEWNYWVGPAAGRGKAGDRPRLERVERLQISLRPEGTPVAPGRYGIELEWITLE